MAEVSLNDVINKYGSLELAIQSALDVEVREVVKAAVAEAALQEVYEAYTPQFFSRRDPVYGGGEAHIQGQRGHGITDPESVVIHVSGNELTAEDNADWQHLWGGQKPSGRLAEAIATGDPRFNMGNAGPRPFHDKAKQIAIESGAVEKALRQGLKRQGIDTTDMTFEIT